MQRCLGCRGGPVRKKGSDFTVACETLKQRAMQRSPEDHPESSLVVMSDAEQQQDAEAQPTQSKPGGQEGKDKPDAPAQTTTTPTSMSLTPPLDKEPGVQSQAESRENAGKTNTSPTAKPCAPPGLAAESDGQGVKKQGKGSSNGRRYVSSMDPLKMDMSQSEVMPLPSSQLSLHCIECHIIFSDLKGKERHMKHSHPAEYEQCILRNSLFACYVCDRHFTNSTELMAHQKAHPDKKPFKCPICSQSFKKSSELTAHKKIHFGQDGYACKDCGKSCKTLTLLKYHQRKHSGEKPYVCKDCGKRFPLSKALQKHVDSHSLDGAEGVEVDTVSTAATTTYKADGASPRVYICSVCKATFKSFRTRQQHLIKHKCDAITNPFRPGLQNIPLISPISISQPALLQVEPNGPLQKVDANIDTEQIRKLIESLGNVQKVNQVVILGQVPPNAPPLRVQQVSEPAAMVALNQGPPQIDFIGLKPTGSKTLQLDTFVSPMDQTIILEPITPEGQLETPSFSELGSHVAAEEHVELTLIPAEQTERLEEEAVHQNLQQPEISPMNYDPSVCQNEVADLKENLEQTFILELTPALMPAAELEQSQSEPQNEVISSSLVQRTEQETPDLAPSDTVEDAKETKIPVPPLTPTVELELASTHPEEQDLSSCPSAPPETLIQAPSESDAKKNTDSDTEKVGLDQMPAINEKTKERDEQDFCKKCPEKEKSSLSTDPQVEAPSKLETKEDQQKSELPVSVMSAQELVKVRKRKPARTFFFQGYMHDLVGSIYRDDFQIDTKPAKRQRTKKSCLVVKFGPQGKDKKSKKQKNPEQEQPPIQDNLIKSKTPPKKLPEKVQKVQTPKKTGKGKKDKTQNMSSGSDTKSPSTHTQQVKQVKDDAKKNKMKKQKETKEDVVHISNQKPVAMLKKKKAAKIIQKDQPKNLKEVKGKKNLKAQKVKNAEATDSNINQDSLLLLKGHKQPQLKVYKLDSLKASGPTQEDSPHDSQSTDISKAGGKKKGARTQKNQKGLSLLSSLQATRQQPQIVPTKPKTTRKRKASLNVETEGVITSKRALECKDCGEKFSEVASLQKHKTTAHIIESPGLTYTNGNIFEGVSGFDLYRLPKEHGGVVRVINAPTDWDTETEMGEMTLEDRDRGVSFPALIPSPSLQIPPQDVEIGIHEDTVESKTGIEDHFCNSSELQSSSDEPNNTETQSNVITEASFPTSTEPKGSNTEEPVAPEEDTQEDPRKNLNFQAKVQGIADEDIKEDVLLEVDLVTVGEQEELDDADPQNESNRVYQSKSEITGKNHKQVGNETREFSLTCQTVSCSTHRPEVKEEEEETLVQRRKEAVKEVAVTGQSRRGELLKSDLISRTSSGLEQEHEADECWIVYEKQLLPSGSETADQEISTKTQPSPGMKTIKDTPPVASLPSVHATVEESSEEAAALELRSLTTGVDEVMNQRRLQGEEERESDQSPGIILERVISSKQGPTADREMSSPTGRSSQSQATGRITENEVQVPEGHEIKVEENSSDTMLVGLTCQNRQSTTGVQPKHHQDIRSILVKEESNSVVNDTLSLQGSRHMQWNVEPINGENTDIPLTEDGDSTKDVSVTPDFNSNQCVFYPVKEEEREVLLGATQTITESSTPEGSANANPSDYQSADCNAHERRSSPPSYQESVVPGLPSEPSVGDLTDGHAASDSELQNPLDLRDFLLQSSDDEDTSGFELSEPQLDKEAEILAYFNKNQTSGKQLPHQSYSKILPNSASHLQAPHDDNRTEKPIDYFSEYFSWDTWVEIASCTNKLSKIPNPVTCREVARFVGIHIAMGTLKFPSARLYWEDLTKVSLIAEAVPLNRFLDLSRILKLCSLNEPKESVTVRQLGDSSQSLVSGHGDSRSSAEPNSSQTDDDPLWKVRPLLYRFNEGCRSLKQPGDYAIDQYPVALTGKIHNNRPSLQCTTLIGLNGLITHLDLELTPAENQDTVEKMVPKGSTLFLCKQELSTPAMLERLLAAGIHGAGRVEGARGHIGDEFVSSDGKLMLRRTHCGFMLSTAGNGQRNMVSLIDSFEKAQTSARLSRDLLNLYSTPLTVSLPTCWPQAVLWHLTDAALVNSWLQYRQDYRSASAPMTFMAFRLEVSKALILSSGLDTQDSVPPQPPEEDTHHATSETPSPGILEESPLPDLTTRYDGTGHWPEQLVEGEGGRCRFGDCQRTSRVLCLKCCVFLCISRNHNCFLNFHNQEGLGEEQ